MKANGPHPGDNQVRASRRRQDKMYSTSTASAEQHLSADHASPIRGRVCGAGANNTEIQPEAFSINANATVQGNARKKCKAPTIRGVRFDSPDPQAPESQRGRKGNVVDLEFAVPATASAFYRELSLGRHKPHEKDSTPLFQLVSLDGRKRGKASVIALHGVVVDYDHGHVGDMERVLRAVRALDLAGFVYGSSGHGDPSRAADGDQAYLESFRVVLPVSRPVAPEEYERLIWGLHGTELPVVDYDDFDRGWDRTCAQYSQAYYVPRPTEHMGALERAAALREGREPELDMHGWGLIGHDIGGSRVIDVDEVLARRADEPEQFVRQCAARTSNRVDRAGKPKPLRPATPRGQQVWQHVRDRMEAWGFEPRASGIGFRTRCPACHGDKDQKSPSFVCSPDGDGVSMKCHACTAKLPAFRAALIDLEGYDQRPALQKAIRGDTPGVLTRGLDDLRANAPAAAPVAADEIYSRVREALRAAIADRKPVVISVDPGVGKTHAADEVTAAMYRDRTIVRLAPSHRVLRESAQRLRKAGVPDADIIEVRSQFRGVEKLRGERRAPPVCPLPQLEDLLRQIDSGQTTGARICGSCGFRSQCPALKNHDKQTQRLRRAGGPGAQPKVILAPHAAAAYVERALAGTEYALIVDEMPQTSTTVRIPIDALESLAEAAQTGKRLDVIGGRRKLLWIAYWAQVAIHRVYPEARPEPERHPAFKGDGTTGRLPTAEPRAGELLGDDDDKLIQHADALLRAHEAGADLAVSRGHVTAVIPDQTYQLLRAQRGILLSATPFRRALPDHQVITFAARDSAPVHRVWFPAARRTKGRSETALAKDDWTPLRQVVHHTNEALDLLAPSARHRRIMRSVIVVSVAAQERIEAMSDEERRAKLGDCSRITWDHHPLVGTNDYTDYDVYVTAWDHWARTRDEVQVVLDIDHADDDDEPSSDAMTIARELTAGHLAQAHGRARDCRRAKPAYHLHFGAVVPGAWHEDNTLVAYSSQAAGFESAQAQVFRALVEAGITDAEIAAVLAGAWRKQDSQPPTAKFVGEARRGEKGVPDAWLLPLRGLISRSKNRS